MPHGCRIIMVRVEDRVRRIRLVEIRVRDRHDESSVAGLAGDLENPTRHRDRNGLQDEPSGTGKATRVRGWAAPRIGIGGRGPAGRCLVDVLPAPGIVVWDRIGHNY